MEELLDVYHWPLISVPVSPVFSAAWYYATDKMALSKIKLDRVIRPLGPMVVPTAAPFGWSCTAGNDRHAAVE